MSKKRILYTFLNFIYFFISICRYAIFSNHVEGTNFSNHVQSRDVIGGGGFLNTLATIHLLCLTHTGYSNMPAQGCYGVKMLFISLFYIYILFKYIYISATNSPWGAPLYSYILMFFGVGTPPVPPGNHLSSFTGSALGTPSFTLFTFFMENGCINCILYKKLRLNSYIFLNPNIFSFFNYFYYSLYV